MLYIYNHAAQATAKAEELTVGNCKRISQFLDNMQTMNGERCLVLTNSAKRLGKNREQTVLEELEPTEEQYTC